MKAIWKGQIRFSLVHIPIKAYRAKNSTNEVSFSHLCPKCYRRLRSQLFCEFCNQVVDKAKAIKGYKISKDEYVPVPEAELNKLKMESDKLIRVDYFCKQVDDIYLDSCYILQPDESDYTYSLFKQVLKDRIAVGNVIMRNKDIPVALKASNGVVVMWTLTEAKEIEVKDVKVNKEELKLAKKLADKMTKPFSKDSLKTEAAERAEKVITRLTKRKVKDTRIEKKKVISLMEQLKKAVNERR